ncbi:hypothetical protein SYNPS1DRAFT_28595 [Syncephalis pseudoplumigaleata]|uniref:YEATS domain-containing protein n=1 Tax=Syncephalis pseudoplumigaleata TaxID=1712513 RepID=A0A4P9Z1R0_9FUNG|nr:hypothetical protein SYNPS1DRAFT_28595 [Syncephalis pseudoplumigaleata]|eukprot:RKP25681.1 hypothetical protein SYNPS1DRAFT_28595 [Syncephalis pseudoplumigaleata]
MAASNNSSSLARKLNEPTVQQTVQHVIEREFNLEILLKRRELSLIRQELAKGEHLLDTLRHIILYHDSDTTHTPDTRSSTVPAATAAHNQGEQDTLLTTMHVGGAMSSPTYRPRRPMRAGTTRKLAHHYGTGPMPLYGRRSDGIFVVMTCPHCRRSDFLNMQGFINHVKHKHQGELASHDEAIELCGVPVPKIKVFDESIDLDHETSRMDDVSTPTTPAAIATQDMASNHPPIETAIDMPGKHRATKQQDNPAAAAAATPAPPNGSSITSITSSGSRFYVKRRITDANEISTYLERVRFYIHPSYRPHDIVDVVKPPFQLLRYGWGEFPVRLQLFFSDTRNKPVDIVHMLRLDDSHSGDQTQGAERTFDIELDRNTRFTTAKDEGSMDGPNGTEPDKMDTVADAPSNGVEETSCAQVDADKADAASKDEHAIDEEHSATTQLDPLLKQAYMHYPLVKMNDTPHATHRRIPYRLACSMDEFAAWTHGRQRSVQWQQARAIRAYLAEHNAVPLPSMRTIINWCRQQPMATIAAQTMDDGKHVVAGSAGAQPPETDASTAVLPSSCTFCKFCGLRHIDASLLGAPWRAACPARPRQFRGPRSTLNSATTAAPLLAQLHQELLRATGNASDDDDDDDDSQMDSEFAPLSTSDEEDQQLDVEDMEIDVEVVDPQWTANNALLGCSAPETDPLEHLATWSMLATMPQVTASPMAIDWIWRVIGELHIPAYLPSALVPARKGRQPGGSSSAGRRDGSGSGNGGSGYRKEERAGRLAMARAFADTGTSAGQKESSPPARTHALRQQTSVGGVLLLATRAFLRHVLDKANEQRTLNERAPASTGQALAISTRERAMLMPFHVYQALYGSSDQFDFLTQRYLEANTTTTTTVDTPATLERTLDGLLEDLKKESSAPAAVSSKAAQEDKPAPSDNDDVRIGEKTQRVARQMQALRGSLKQQAEAAGDPLASTLRQRQGDAETLLTELTRTSHR